VDVRIICATNRNLETGIQQGGFRDDLFYRLNEITLLLPSLRERIEDVTLLVSHFMNKYNTQYSKSLAGLSETVMAQLRAFAWPGNVRQLENMIKQVVVRGDESIITDLLRSTGRQQVPVPVSDGNEVATIASGPAEGENSYSLKVRLNRIIADEEKKLIKEVLTKTNWNRRRAADLLEISYRSLLYKIKDYNLNS
jgi:two-component system response regulator AtoC